jgi:hypothetical protein
MQTEKENKNLFARAGAFPFPAALISSSGILDGVILVLITLITAVIRWQGWAQMALMNLDMLPYNVGAADFLRSGQILDRGDIGSYFSYNPPGTVYFIIPGLILSSDPRLWEIPGSLILHFATVLFLYLIARKVFSRPVALTSALVFSLSLIGAPSLMPLGHPAFFVGTVYFLLLWAKDRAKWALPAALVVSALGLYDDMGILPLVLAYPIVWIVYRPPLFWRGILVAAVLSLLIWFPYLRFEMTRDFIDLRSILLLQSVPGLQAGKPEADSSFCPASLPGTSDTWEGEYARLGVQEAGSKYVVYHNDTARGEIVLRVCRFFTNLDRNFDANFFLFGQNIANNVLVWIFFAGGVVGAFLIAIKRWRWTAGWVDKLQGKGAWISAGAGIFICASIWIVFSPEIAARYLTADGKLDPGSHGVLEQWRTFAPLCLGAWLVGIFFLKRWRNEPTNGIGVVGLAFLIPWLLLTEVAETNRAIRFWWIWPLEVLFLVAGVESLSVLWQRKRVACGVLMAIVILITFPRIYIFGKLDQWQRTSYAGQDTHQLEAADYLGQVILSQQDAAPSIGYDVMHYSNIYEFSARTQSLLYRMGSWFDFLLDYRFGIRNSNQSVEGLSDQDQYRIYQIPAGEPARAESPWEGFRLLGTFGDYQVYER